MFDLQAHNARRALTRYSSFEVGMFTPTLQHSTMTSTTLGARTQRNNPRSWTAHPTTGTANRTIHNHSTFLPSPPAPRSHPAHLPLPVSSPPFAPTHRSSRQATNVAQILPRPPPRTRRHTAFDSVRWTALYAEAIHHCRLAARESA